MPSIVGALKDRDFWRSVGRNAGQAAEGMTSGILGAPVDLVTMAMRPFGYAVPDENVIGSSEWFGRMQKSDRDGLPYIAGTFGIPDVRDAGMFAVAGLRAMRRAAPLKVRQARANEGGFYETHVYHGTGGDVPAFDLSRGGATSGSSVGRLGVSVSPDPEVASEFASQAAHAGGAANVMPLRFRAQSVGRIELDGTETNQEMAGAIQDAWDAGFEAVELTNYTTPGGLTGREILVVRDPSQVRSVHAEFNPKKRTSSNLMASGLIGSLGLGLLSSREREE